MRVLQPRDKFDLAEKSLGADRSSQLLVEDLDRDLAVVPSVTRHKYCGHAAAADLAFEDVPTAELALELVEETSHPAKPLLL